MTLGGYLTKVLGLRIFAAVIVLLALGLSLDLIKAADSLVVEGGAPALMHYSLLRAPAIGAQILPLSVLVGGMVGFLALGRRSELTVLRAAGQSVFRLLLRLLPLAAGLGLAQHLLIDQGIPWSERALGDAYGEIADLPVPPEGARVAGRIEGAVIIGRLARRDGTALAPLTLYALNAKGQVTGAIEAQHARFNSGQWHLREVRRIGETPARDTLSLLSHRTLSPATVLAMAGSEASATAGEAAAAIAGHTVATRSMDYYATRIAQSRAAFAVPAVMLLFATFASFKGPRGSAGLGIAAIGTVLGLGFLIVDGIFASLGKLGIFPAEIAAWAAAVLFATAGIWVLLMKEE